MPVGSLWSSAVESALVCLSPQQSTEKVYPSPSLGRHRHPSSGTAREALEQILRGITPDERDRVVFTPNVLFLAKVRYDSQDPAHAIEFSFQAYASPELPLAAIPTAAPHVPVHYFRLEHHPCAPGLIFGEPALHLHSIGNGPPRAPVDFGPVGSPLLWFLEFLTFNYDYSTWSCWFEAIADDIGIHSSFALLDDAFRTATIHSTARHLYPDLRQIVGATIETKTKAMSALGTMRFAEPLDGTLNYRFG